jgi:two-component system cell cycle sensor histidine kinase/response regulator CckA
VNSSALEQEVLLLRARVAELEDRLRGVDKTEELLLDARAQAQALLDNIPHLAWMKNTASVFLAVNDAFARATGRSKSEILGRTDIEVWPRELSVRYMADDRRVMASGERFFVEERISEAGEVKWFETFKAPLRDSKGVVVGTVGLAREITERKRAEEQRQLLERRIQETQRLESLGVLAGGIAHDFNNLLVGVLSNSELALEALNRAPGQGQVAERIAAVRNSALRAAELTNQMLAYSGRGHFDVRPISLTEMIREMDHLLGASISKKARVHYRLFANLPAVQADVAQMRQVIMNLVINASDALEDREGDVYVHTGAEQRHDVVSDVCGPVPLPPGPYAFLEVADDGCGMNDETRSRIFEPFFTTKCTGRGLGLSAVQGIVRGHGGGIVLHTAPGAGTRIKVLLPCSDLPAVHLTRPKPEAVGEWAGSGLVLLVDDDARVRLVTELLLRSIGFDVLATGTGRDAIREFERRASEVKLVVLDVTMPDLNGDQVLQELRRSRPDIPVLLCSGYSEEEMCHRFSAEDMAMFLQKPYPFDVFRARLRALLERSSVH